MLTLAKAGPDQFRPAFFCPAHPRASAPDMPLYSLGDLVPRLGERAWAAPSADLIGDVRLGARASVWFGAVIRADNTPIVVGEESNIQDGSVCHSDAGFPLTIGARVTVGHQAILHGCTVADDCLIGLGARILNGAMIERECIVGAGALITEGKRFERGSLIVGAPARVVRQVTEEEKQMLRASAAHYAEKAGRYAAELNAV
jgi:carbonic anhydrase/acetyltransferase-like protein (isoleucine patch superfamily)